MEKYLISKVYIIVGKPRDEDEISEDLLERVKLNQKLGKRKVGV